MTPFGLNPNSVILKEELDENKILTFGWQIENYEILPNRIKVQFAKVISPNEVEVSIWKRGAGWPFVSGSSSCAVAATVLTHIAGKFQKLQKNG